MLSLSTIAILFTFSSILASQRGLFSTLEGETGLFAREILRSGEWLAIHRNGKEFNEKPPFFYWTVAGFSWIAGAVSELTCRLPSLAGALLILFLFARLSPGREGRHLWILSAAVFISSPKVFWMSQVARIDMLFTLFCFSAVLSYSAYLEGGKGAAVHHFLFFASAAFAVLMKGPIGMILPFLAASLFLLLRRRFREIRRLFLGEGMLVFLAITIPLYGLVILKTEGRFFDRFFKVENLARFFGSLDLSLGDTFYRQPWWYCLMYFLAGFFPWSLFFPAFLWSHFKKRGARSSQDSLLLAYVFVVLCFFSLAGVKRSDYILPLYPAAACLVARYIQREAAPIRSRWLFAGFAACGGIALLAITWHRLAPFPGWEESLIFRFLPPEKLEDGRLVAGQLREAFPWIAVLFLAILSACAYALVSGKRFSAVFTVQAMTLSSFLFAIAVAYPFAARNTDIRPFCRAIQEEVGGEELRFYKSWREDVAFYLDRTIDVASEKDLASALDRKDRKVFFLIDREDYQGLLREGKRFPRVYGDGTPKLRPLYLVSGD